MLALIMVTVQLTCVTAVYKTASGDKTASAVTQTDALTPTDTDVPDDGEIVATISVYGHIRSIFKSGHTWIYIENVSDHDIQVALCTIPPNEGISFGTFFLTRSDGGGLYYNIETHCGNKYGTQGCSSLTEGITAEQLEQVNEKLINSNSFGLINNCTRFTLSIWNSVAKTKIIPIAVPIIAFLQIKLMGGQSDRPMFYAPADEVYKQIGNGDDAYIITVSEKSLENPI